MKIAIIGRKKDTLRYESYLSALPAQAVTTLFLGELPSCDAVVLPGGGDITPAFFGERNTGSRNIDTELDILQFQAVDHCIRSRTPLLGICKGMQVINVAFGGSIIQELPASTIHSYQGEDQYHPTYAAGDSFLTGLYGEQFVVNSAHHQGLGRLGKGLLPIQWCSRDHCIEAIIHEELPIIGLQWHPERLDSKKTAITGSPLLSYFASLISASA